MSKNKVAKRFGIVSLCLVAAVSAFSGIKSTATDVASATGAMQATEFVHTAATVTRDENGLCIASDSAYTATMRTVFTGNTTFKFRFAEDIDAAIYGDFNFRISDVTNENNYFDIKYYVSKSSSTQADNYTGVYMQYQDQIRMASASGSSTAYNSIQKGSAASNFAPHFLNYGNRNTREGILTLNWSDDVLVIKTNTSKLSTATTMHTMAKFDGTYDETVSKKGFSGKQTGNCGLPKLSFPEGYTVTISSDFTKTGVEDHGSDVLFSSIVNDDVTYDFKAATEFTKDSKMAAFESKYAALTVADIPTQVPGKVFIGWRNTETKKLYPAHSIMQQGKYEAYVLNYDTVNGASVRLAGKSGIRFQTMFDAEQYTELKEAGHIQTFGTLLAYTDTLTTVGKEFTIENYQAEETFAKVENTKGVFNYTDKAGKAYKAYTIGVVDIAAENYTKAYSTRGYLVVIYSNGVTGTVYTDYNATDNSRSIAVVANRLKTNDADAYNAMTDAQKAIIDAYAAAYVAA